MQENIRGKKVIIVGLGRLGGGIAAAKYIVSKGAKLTVSDMLDKDALKPAIRKLKKFRNIKFILGKQRENDFKGKDIAICNPAVPIHSPLVRYAKKYCGEVYNDLSFFLSHLPPATPYIAVTGTRGKTTVTTWIGHFLKLAIIGGNMPQNGLFKILQRADISQKPLVLELSSFQLEYMGPHMLPPRVAIITNLYRDHINRHKTFKKYRDTKANLFKYQKPTDALILNADSPQTKYFLNMKPAANLWFVTCKSNGIPKKSQGLCIRGDNIISIEKEKETIIGPMPKEMSGHQRYNMLEAMLAAHLWGKSYKELMPRIHSLPSVPFRQELVLERKGLKVYNDSAATSPEATIAALERFKGPGTAFICGGTDKMLDFKPLAGKLRTLPKDMIFLLEGSGTKKLMKNLKGGGIKTYADLEDIIREITKNKKIKTIVFSPGAASFEKFKNEFDRGKRFNALIRKYMGWL